MFTTLVTNYQLQNYPLWIQCLCGVSDPEEGENPSLTQIQSRVPSHGSLWRLSLSLCSPVQSLSYAFASQLPFDSCLFCVALTKEKAVYEGGGRTLKSGNVLCAVFLSPRLALCISDCDQEAPQMPRGCFCCGNRSVKRWDGGLPRWAVFVFCCCFVFLSLWVVPFPPVRSPPWILVNSESLLTHLFLPSSSSSSLSFSPLTSSLLHFSGNNLLLPFPIPEDWEIKSRLGLGGSVKIAKQSSLTVTAPGFVRKPLPILPSLLIPLLPPFLFPTFFLPDGTGFQQGVIIYKSSNLICC